MFYSSTQQPKTLLRNHKKFEHFIHWPFHLCTWCRIIPQFLRVRISGILLRSSVCCLKCERFSQWCTRALDRGISLSLFLPRVNLFIWSLRSITRRLNLGGSWSHRNRWLDPPSLKGYALRSLFYSPKMPMKRACVYEDASLRDSIIIMGIIRMFTTTFLSMLILLL